MSTVSIVDTESFIRFSKKRCPELRAYIATAFAQETPEAASAQWRSVADQIRPKVPKLATIMDDAEEDVLA
ncbi:hypothetical protein L614_000200003140 [Ochrobactrum sp. J50]|nr:hypothetical protein L614_000200003140 [Ochrobactrum sp. J50]